MAGSFKNTFRGIGKGGKMKGAADIGPVVARHYLGDEDGQTPGDKG